MNTTLPGNLRYQPKELIPMFGYDNLYQTVGEVELATLEVLNEIGMIPNDAMALLTPKKRKEILAIPTTEVDRIERQITNHDIRAWVLRAQEILGQKLGRWIHIPLTSYDPLSTGRVLQFVRAHQKAIKPSVKAVCVILVDMVERFSGVVQIGRTHGQHAVPITVGFWLATILDRILTNGEEMERHASLLKGKVSGAVGAHNAERGLGFADRCGSKSFDERVLEKLGLSPVPIATQILPPEGLAYYLHSCVMLSAALAQFGRDGRNLMRSEIGEIAEEYEASQVGSSTMPHKRNPLSFENLEGMFQKNLGELLKLYLTLVSKHQRDLTGSSVARDFPIIVVNLQQQLNTLLRSDKKGAPWLSRIRVSEDALQRNLAMNAHVIMSEALQIALRIADYKFDAYNFVDKRLVPEAQRSKKHLMEVCREYAEYDEDLKEALARIPEGVVALFHNPEGYTGNAQELALSTANRARERLETW